MPMWRGGKRVAVVVERVFQNADPSDGAADMQLAAVIDDRDAGGVVAAIFQAFQAFNEQRLSDFPADIRNNSAHANLRGQTTQSFQITVSIWRINDLWSEVFSEAVPRPGNASEHYAP